TANAFVQTTTDPMVRGRVLSLYFAILMGGTPIGAPIVGAISDAFGARFGLGVAAASGFIAFAVGVSWLIGERRLRVRLGARGRLIVTHAGRPEGGPAMPGQEETLTAPVSVLRRGPLILSEPNSAPQSSAISEALTGPVLLNDLDFEPEARRKPKPDEDR